MRLSGLLAWVMWLSVHIMYLIGFRNRLLVMLQWAWAYSTRQKSARLITCEPPSERHMGSALPARARQTANITEQHIQTQQEVP